MTKLSFEYRDDSGRVKTTSIELRRENGDEFGSIWESAIDDLLSKKSGLTRLPADTLGVQHVFTVRAQELPGDTLGRIEEDSDFPGVYSIDLASSINSTEILAATINGALDKLATRGIGSFKAEAVRPEAASPRITISHTHTPRVAPTSPPGIDLGEAGRSGSISSQRPMNRLDSVRLAIEATGEARRKGGRAGDRFRELSSDSEAGTPRAPGAGLGVRVRSESIASQGLGLERIDSLARAMSAVAAARGTRGRVKAGQVFRESSGSEAGTPRAAPTETPRAAGAKTLGIRRVSVAPRFNRAEAEEAPADVGVVSDILGASLAPPRTGPRVQMMPGIRVVEEGSQPADHVSSRPADGTDTLPITNLLRRQRRATPTPKVTLAVPATISPTAAQPDAAARTSPVVTANEEGAGATRAAPPLSASTVIAPAAGAITPPAPTVTDAERIRMNFRRTVEQIRSATKATQPRTTTEGSVAQPISERRLTSATTAAVEDPASQAVTPRLGLLSGAGSPARGLRARLSPTLFTDPSGFGAASPSSGRESEVGAGEASRGASPAPGEIDMRRLASLLLQRRSPRPGVSPPPPEGYAPTTPYFVSPALPSAPGSMHYPAGAHARETVLTPTTGAPGGAGFASAPDASRAQPETAVSSGATTPAASPRTAGVANRLLRLREGVGRGGRGGGDGPS